jgi:hypothetical protein
MQSESPPALPGPPPPVTRQLYPRAPVRLAQASALGVPALLATYALGLNILVDLVNMTVVPVATHRLLGGAGDDDVLVRITHALPPVQIFTVVAMLASFITWLFLARRNLDVWNQHDLAWGPGWAVFGWFVPLYNAFVPPVLMYTVVRGSRIALGEGDRASGAPALVWTWWGTLVGSRLVFSVLSLHELPSTAGIGGIVAYHAIPCLLSIVAATLAIILVRRVTALQERRLETATPA